MNARTRANLVVGAIILILVGTITGIIIQAKINAQNDDQDDVIQGVILRNRLGNYKACVHNGNSFRHQVRDEFVGLKADVLIPVFSQVAATIPDGAPSKEILDDAVTYLHHRIDTIAQRIPNAHCREAFPPLAGQTYPDLKPSP